MSETSPQNPVKTQNDIVIATLQEYLAKQPHS